MITYQQADQAPVPTANPIVHCWDFRPSVTERRRLCLSWNLVYVAQLVFAVWKDTDWQWKLARLRDKV